MKTKPKVIVILGPTSSGKTEMSIKLAKQWNGVIISADSRQFYRGMNIATAKTTKEQQQGVPHYMIDIANPDQDFNLSLYQTTVYNLLHTINRWNWIRPRKVVPFIVGGTGLYIQAIVDGYQLPRVAPNLKLREISEKKSIVALARELKKLDPKTTVDLNNKRRVVRAIEVLRSGGKLENKFVPPNFDFLQIGIQRPPDELNQRIHQKIQQMHKQGVVKEAKELLAKGYDFNKPAFSALGYQHIRDYLKGRLSLAKALELMESDTKKFAKRQITWFKRDKRIHWVSNLKEAEGLIADFIKS
jgi:tRNA dimethylallyltransferase